MSEAIPGVEFDPPPARVRDAAVVVLARGDGADLELFWVRRGERLAFSGGFYAFPGGSVDRSDRELQVAGCSPQDAPLLACAIRETFEEAGVLLLPQALGWPAQRLAGLRAELLSGTPFGTLLAREGLTLDASLLLAAGRWLTPPISPIRFDARFFLARVADGTLASVIPGELSDGAWIAPAAALRRWESGQALLHPPNRHVLAVLAGYPIESAVPQLRRPTFMGEDHVPHRVEFQRGVQLQPLRTPTLPPFRHTNCWVVGTGELALIDPGAPWTEEQDKLDAYLRELMDEGLRPRYVLLTHHHRDHSGGALEAGRRLGVPVLGSAETARRVPGVEGRLGDGAVVELAGPLPLRLRAVLTEGHAAGHLCFLEEASRALFAGDMVAGGTTVVIDPPEGDLAVYLASLRRLQELGVGTLYPAHGFPIPDGPARLAEYVEHREQRLRQVREALHAGGSSITEIVERVYADTPPFLHPVAQRSALASLLELQRRGEARSQGETWAGRG